MARVCKVVCKYFLSGFPDTVFKMHFSSLGSYDSWRNASVNANKIVLSTHIMYDYPDEVYCKKYPKGVRAENRSLFE